MKRHTERKPTANHLVICMNSHLFFKTLSNIYDIKTSMYTPFLYYLSAVLDVAWQHYIWSEYFVYMIQLDKNVYKYTYSLLIIYKCFILFLNLKYQKKILNSFLNFLQCKIK